MTIHYLKANINEGKLVLTSENGLTLTVENAEAKEFFIRATESKDIQTNQSIDDSYCVCGAKHGINNNENKNRWVCNDCGIKFKI